MGYRDTGIQGCRGVWGYRDTGTRGYRGTYEKHDKGLQVTWDTVFRGTVIQL